MVDPEVQISSMLPDAPPYRGPAGVRAWWDRILTVFPDWHGEIERVRAFDDTVVTTLRAVAHGIDSGAPMHQRFWNAARFKGGRVVWWGFFPTEDEAFAALSMGEPRSSRD